MLVPLVVGLASIAIPAVPARAAVTYLVTTTADALDSDPSDGMCLAAGVGCTLRAAIQQANETAARDRIAFKIPGAGPHTIRPLGSLPAIVNPIIIDGYTQRGARRNTLAAGSNAVLAIALDGSMAPSGNGLVLRTDRSIIRGLAINRFTGLFGEPPSEGIGVWIDVGSDNVVEGNFIGTDVGGEIARPNDVGVAVGAAGPGDVSQRNVIGGMTPWRRNVISANNVRGIEIFGGGASSNEILGNLIGTSATGRAPLGNGNGVSLLGAPGNVVGGPTVDARNIVSANRLIGISIFQSPITDLATGNRIEGNFIGTDVTGTQRLGNGSSVAGPFPGIEVARADDTVIGGTAEGAGNLISGNVGGGIRGTGSGDPFAPDVPRGTVIQGNLIGTDIDGKLPLGNGDDGINLIGSDHVVGGSDPGAGNLVSGNTGTGMTIAGDGDVIQGNLVGTDVSGFIALGNGDVGIVYSGIDSTIGGTMPGAGNVVGANLAGLQLVDVARISVQGNKIGVDATGATAVGNAGHGVVLQRAADVLVGGSVSGAGNVISANAGDGVLIFDGSPGNRVLGNEIGTDAAGTEALPNGGVGVFAGADRTTIGGPGAAGNLISGNGSSNDHAGVTLQGSNSVVQGNLIGTDASGFLAIGNFHDGIAVFGNDNVIGGAGPGERNIVSGNGRDGIRISGDDNRILGNLIGIGIEGDPLGNDGNGLGIAFGVRTSIGGSAPGAGNVVAFNKAAGVLVAVGVGHHLESNSIYENGLLGIDLEGDGVTINDEEDVDVGANMLQNFPVLTDVSVVTALGITKIEGVLDSTPNTDFRLEFFSNDVCDPTGHGEGRLVLGSMVVATDGFGHADFVASFLVVVPEGAEVTTTATDFEADNNTSEFSMCRGAELG